LGHQAIGQAFGGKLVNLSTVYHGVAMPVQLVNRESVYARASAGKSANVKRETGKSESAVAAEVANSPVLSEVEGTTHHSLFEGLPDEFEVGRYHSWVISEEGFPAELEITARDANNFIMALQHVTYDVQGVQFHPESVLTPKGEDIMRNWLKS
jgi:anthranilate synthase component 2